MENEKVLNEKSYEEVKKGISFSGNMVSIIGERTVELDDGRIIDQYIYNIDGYEAKNGKPFVSLKDNIYLV